MAKYEMADMKSEDRQAKYDSKYRPSAEAPQGIVTSGQFSNTGKVDSGGSPQNRSGSSKNA